jgi:hypothetical protein
MGSAHIHGPLWGARVRDYFFGTIAGTVPIPEFFVPENLGRIIGAPS